MKIVIAMDSFKGSLSSAELANVAEEGIKNVYADAQIIKIPVADGGEGTVEAMVNGSSGKFHELIVHGPLLNPVEAIYGISGNGKTAIIEMAAASGLPLITEEQKNPLKTTTYGTGELIKDAIKRGCKEFLIGIGGSATNDCGLGMLKALGMKFLDINGNELQSGGENLIEVQSIDDSNFLSEIAQCDFKIACDVDNPLYGKNGAAHVYGKQKGADPHGIKKLDEGLKHFSEIVINKYNIDMNEQPGAGAAGGLGGAFYAFFKGDLEPGVDIILKTAKVEEQLKDADFVITGEGRMDFQSVMGKTPTGVSKLAAKHDVPVIALAGSLSDDAEAVHDYGIDAIFSIINYPIDLKEAMGKEKTSTFMKKNIEEIFRLIKTCETKFKQ